MLGVHLPAVGTTAICFCNNPSVLYCSQIGKRGVVEKPNIEDLRLLRCARIDKNAHSVIARSEATKQSRLFQQSQHSRLLPKKGKGKGKIRG